MAAPFLETAQFLHIQAGQAPNLTVVPDAEPNHELMYEHSREAFDRYLDERDQAQVVDKIEGEELHAVQESVRAWAEGAGLLHVPDKLEDRLRYYTDFSEEMAVEKIVGLVDFLEKEHSDKISKVELDATRSFVESAFSMYEARPGDGSVAPDADGSFAFVVPARMGRNHPDYGQEVEPTIPAFRYLPNELRAHMMIGLPPFVIDTYQQNEQGKRGYLVLAPVFEDMLTDLGASMSFLSRAGTNNINAAVDFAYERFGVNTIGLGAVLPALTNYGKTITNKNVTLTTGHGGTTEFINRIVESSLQGRKPESIGVLGLGAIGEAIARILANKYPDSKINIFDVKENRIDRVKATGETFVGRTSVKDVIDNSDIIVSAVTDRLDLEALGVNPLNGRVAVDDSQPGSVDPEQAERMGGAVRWAIGSDPTGKVARRRGYDYATMVDPHADLFGCEAEAASIAAYGYELEARGLPRAAIARIIDKVAVHGRVSVQKTRYIGALFTKFGIVPSAPQAFGRPVVLPNQRAA